MASEQTGPHKDGEGAATGGYGDNISADGRTEMSLDGWKTVATVDDYTLQIYESSSYEDGAMSFKRWHKLFCGGKMIWEKSSRWYESRLTYNQYGSSHTAELKKAEEEDGLKDHTKVILVYVVISEKQEEKKS